MNQHNRMHLINRIVENWDLKPTSQRFALHALVFGNITYHSNGHNHELSWMVDMIRNDVRCDLDSIKSFLNAHSWN
jgi:hypothetical protein